MNLCRVKQTEKKKKKLISNWRLILTQNWKFGDLELPLKLFSKRQRQTTG